MTAHFAAICGRPEAIARVAATVADQSEVEICEVSPGIFLLVNDPTSVHILPEQCGVIIGTLFHRYGPPEAVHSLGSADSSAIVATGGELLLQRFWGSYVAIFSTNRGLMVLRDPSGTMPCHYIIRQDMVVLGSDPELLLNIASLRPEVDTRGLLHSIAFLGLPSERTALDGVNDLLPGMSIRVQDNDVVVEVRWNPWDFVAIAQGEDAQENIVQLRRRIEYCISSWASVYDRGLAAVSGGLDSSIVAACLAKTGALQACLTLVTNDPLGDERPYSGLLAEHLHVPIAEEYYSIEDIDLDRSSVSHRARPFGRLDALAYDAAAVRTANSLGSTAIFSGNGGDNVFYLSHSARGWADRYLAEGISWGLVETARNICQVTGANLLQLLRHGIQAVRLADKPYKWVPDTAFLSGDAIAALVDHEITHPWLRTPPNGSLPGKAAHVAMLMRMQHSIEGYAERAGVPVIHPLVSQPILELCLAIPTWQQCSGGRDRAIARSAFAGALPASLIERRNKGSPQGFAFEAFRHFRANIRERLMDGWLIENRILDKQTVEAALEPDVRHDSRAMLRLSLLVDTEAWINQWRHRAKDAATTAPDFDAPGLSPTIRAG
ncbi:hypothetical protein KNJ79_09405 [Sphingopyxis indica]|uniref:asparagine synthase-related protein n=1 Tax=Sphingopyxis indica TaxID=436663 RepID=UPI002938DBA6|nr:asparagine synthase-related protein [Sphingopyxis indica]WOF45063.1 hypothetical protein KNJ79_09405 [Sphingopyxis indica]